METDTKMGFKNGVNVLLERKNINHLFSLRNEVREHAEYIKYQELTIYLQFARILRESGTVRIPDNILPSVDVAFVLSVVREALHRLEAQETCLHTSNERIS